MENHLDMKYLLFINLIFLISTKLHSNPNVVPIETVYKFLLEKNSFKSDSEIGAYINFTLTEYLQSTLKIQKIGYRQFFNNYMDSAYIDKAGIVFKIDTTDLSKKFNSIGYTQNKRKKYLISLINEKGVDLYNSTELLDMKHSTSFLFNLNSRYRYKISDSILPKLYPFFKKKFHRIHNDNERMIYLLRLEIFMSHQLQEDENEFVQRLNLFDNSFNTNVSNNRLAEVYYYFGLNLINTDDQDIGYGYLFKSYQLGLNGYNLFSQQSHYEILKRVNNNYADLINSKNSLYSYKFGNSNKFSQISELFTEPLNNQKNILIKDVFFKKIPTSKLDIEYSLLLYNTIFNIDFGRNSDFNLTTPSLIEKNGSKLHMYSLYEIIKLLDYAKKHNILISPEIISNSLTNIASYFWYKDYDLQVYSSYAAFTVFKLDYSNYNEYGNLYKIFCDGAERSWPYRKGLAAKFINDGLEIFKKCPDKSAFYKMLSSKMILNLTERKFDVAKAIFDSMSLAISHDTSYDNNNNLLRKIDYNYYNSILNERIRFGDTIFNKDDSISRLKYTLKDYYFEDMKSESIADMKSQYKFLQSIQTALSEIEQLNMKRIIGVKADQIVKLNDTITSKLSKITKQQNTIGQLNSDIDLKTSELTVSSNAIDRLKFISDSLNNDIKHKKQDIKEVQQRLNYGALFALVIITGIFLYYSSILKSKNKSLVIANNTIKTETEERILATNEASLYKANFLRKRLDIHHMKGGLPGLAIKIGLICNEIQENNSVSDLIKSKILKASINADKLRDYVMECITNSKKQLAPIKYEIINAQNYVSLFNLDSQYQISLQLSDKLTQLQDKIQFPTNLLQPVVQNCIEHAFSNKDGIADKKILIDIIEDGTGLYTLIISDNGCGLSNKKTNEQYKVNSKISLEDIKNYLSILKNQRVSNIYFDVKSCMMGNESGIGTSVKFLNVTA